MSTSNSKLKWPHRQIRWSHDFTTIVEKTIISPISDTHPSSSRSSSGMSFLSRRKLLMMFAVLSEGRGISVLLPTSRAGTSIWFTVHMSPLMFSTIGRVTECLLTSFKSTGVRSLSGVRAHVDFQVFQSGECLVAGFEL